MEANRLGVNVEELRSRVLGMAHATFSNWPHECEPLASALMEEGRDWWVGRLTAPVAEFPKETHCLHMKTELKSVSFLCNAGDFEQLMTLSNVVVQLKNLKWLDHATEGARLRRNQAL